MGPTWIQDKMAAKTNAKSSNGNVLVSAHGAYRPKDTYKRSRVHTQLDDYADWCRWNPGCDDIQT